MQIDAIKDIIPAYTTVTVVYDIQKAKQQPNLSAYESMRKQLETAFQKSTTNNIIKTNIEIPVCYDPFFGIDLPVMAQQKKLSVEQIIHMHASAIYNVYMLGFLPGFAYMGTVNYLIAKPRLPTPRIHVAAGSIGIAGNQTGIYPFDSPGGWNIIGRTPLPLFDATKENPCSLQPGNTVQFIPITKVAFEHYKTPA